MKKRSGQILILVLLVVVVALAVGLSVASRNITNLRTSAQTEQSQRAFSTAEGGVEDVLSRLTDVNKVIAGTGTSPNCSSSGGSQATCNVAVGNLTANVSVASTNTYQQVIDEGNVGQIDLQGPPAATGTIQIEWALASDTSESGSPASIEVTLISGPSGGLYSQARTAWAGVSGRANENGFPPPTNCTPTTFARCTQLPALLPGSSPLLLRIRPFWNKATVRVTSIGGALPAQTYNLASTAKTDLGITRKVQVTRTAKPQLPAVFDYVLFSEGEIVK